MKLFKLKTAGLNPDYYIAAHTNIEALATLFMDCEMSFDELDYEDKIIEVPESEWENIDVTYDHEVLNLVYVMKDRKYAEVIWSDPAEE